MCGSRPRRRGSSTSGTPGRCCSTGCTRATRAAPSSSASRTPTSSGRRRRRSTDPARPAMARPPLGRRAGLPEPSLRRLSRRGRPSRRRGRRVRVLLHGREVKARNDAAMKTGQRPGYDGRCRDLTPPSATPAVADGLPRSIRFRTPDTGRSMFVDVDPRRGRRRVVDDLRLRHRPVQRHSRVLPRQRGRRHRHGHHTRAARRGPDRLDPPCAGAPARARGRRATRVRALAADRRPRWRQALEAPRRGLGRGVPGAGLPRRRDRQLPRAARLGARRRPGSARSRRAGRRVRSRTGELLGRRVRRAEARVDECRAHPASAGGGVRGGDVAVRQGALRRPARHPHVRSRSRSSRRNDRRRWCRSPTRPSSSSSPTTNSRSRPTPWKQCASSTRSTS